MDGADGATNEELDVLNSLRRCLRPAATARAAALPFFPPTADALGAAWLVTVVAARHTKQNRAG